MSLNENSKNRVEKLIKRVETYAYEIGSTLLDTSFTGTTDKVRLICNKCKTKREVGIGVMLSTRTKCPKCATNNIVDNHSQTLEEMVMHAKGRGGELISTVYIGYNKKYKWKCSCGNIWEANWNRVKNKGSWCPKCRTNRRNLDKIACNSEKRIVNNAKKVESKKILELKIRNEAKGKLQAKLKKDIERIKSKNKTIVSVDGTMQNPTYTLKCKICGYTSDYNKYSFKSMGCRGCAGTAPLTLEKAQLIARKRGGKLLSEDVISNRNKLRWQCKSGHVWEANFNSITGGGSWCPHCAKKIYKKENMFRYVLEAITEEKFPNGRNSGIYGRAGYQLELDGSNKELGIAFEYQGEQHFFVQNYDKNTEKGKAKLKRVKENDRIKLEACVAKDILLMTPNYKNKPKDFEKIICESLLSIGRDDLIKNIDIDWNEWYAHY